MSSRSFVRAAAALVVAVLAGTAVPVPPAGAAGTPTSIRLSQATDKAAVGSIHEVVARVTDASGNPVADGTAVTFQTGETWLPEGRTWVGFGPTPDDRGYYLADSMGSVVSFGEAVEGRSHALGAEAVEVRSTPSGRGYWLASANGGVRAAGDALFLGSMESGPLPRPVIGMAATPTGQGYWLAGADGVVYPFGDAGFFGDMHGVTLSRSIVAFEATPSGKGYWMLVDDGGIFAFGDARFFGSMGGIRLNAPIVDLASTLTGKGYWLVAADGGIFSFGDAKFFGSTGARPLAGPVVSMAPTASGLGYRMLGSDGSVFAFGDASFFGPTTIEVIASGQATLRFTSWKSGGSTTRVRVAPLTGWSGLITIWTSGSEPTPAATPPSAPATVQASAGTDGVFVTWTEPTAGGPVAGYTVTVTPGGRTIEVPGDTTWVAVTGLETGTTYQFTVTAHNAAGRSGPSPASNPVIPGVPVTGAGPGAPAGTTTRSGYWMLGTDGAVYAFGDAAHLGNPGLAAKVTAVDLEPTPSGQGYWVLDSAGGVHCRGDARDHGDPDPSKLAPGEAFTSLSATPTGGGYWVFTTRGRVLTFGDAGSFGDVSGITLNGPVLDSIPTPSGQGYYMVAADGGIFTFGDAAFAGSMGGTRLNAPVQSLVPDGDGAGYWLVASDGGIFAFDAPFRGSLGGQRLNRPVTGMVRFGNGYLMVGEDGGIFNFSDRQFHGSLGATPPARPVVSVAALR